MRQYFVRYWSDMVRGMALHSVHSSMAEARAAASGLINSFRVHGLGREAASVRVEHQ